MLWIVCTALQQVSYSRHATNAVPSHLYNWKGCLQYIEEGTLLQVTYKWLRKSITSEREVVEFREMCRNDDSHYAVSRRSVSRVR